MATESILVKTKDNCVIVFSIDYANAAEKARMTHECESLCSSINYAEGFSITTSHGITYDAQNSQFLNKEILGYHYHKNPHNYRNEMASDSYPMEVSQPNTIHFSKTIPDTDVSEVIKNIGYRLEAKDYLCQVRRVGDNYEVLNYQKTRAAVYQGENRIEFTRHHYQFPPAEYAELQAMISAFDSAKRANPLLDIYDYARDNIARGRSYNLFKVYADEYTRTQHLDTTVEHELKHIKNGIFYHGLSLKKDAKRLSVEDCYRISVEDERSAYMSQMVSSINKYLKGGNLNDFSMFDNDSDTIRNELQALSSDAEKIAYATNLPLLTKKMLEHFKSAHKNDYDINQFPESTANMVDTQPVTAAIDGDRSWFKKLRSLYYNFEIYNPRTGRTEPKDLAQYITPDLDVEITDEVSRTIIEPLKNTMQNKVNTVATQVANGDINPELIEPAKALMRDTVHQSTYINQVDNFRVSTLYDDEAENTPTPHQPSEPEQAPIPTDRSDWSDNLQAFWRNVDGYQEVAKNNVEYKFKVHDATVKYSSPHQVEVSSNAEYDLYNKLMQEPTNKNKKVEFLDTLSKEQALMLYIACVNNGRQMTGAVPTDLSEINNLRGIPATELRKFQQRISESGQQTAQPTNSQPTPQRQNSSSVSRMNQIMMKKRFMGR